MKRYEALVDSQTREGCRVLTLLAILLVPTYTFLDYFTQREYFWDLTINRVITVFLFLMMFIYVRKKYHELNPFWVGYAALTLATVSITDQCYITGGIASPYYVGVLIVLLAGALTFPVLPLHMLNFVFVTIVIYLLGGFIQSDFVITHPEELINNIFSLFSVGIIGVIAARLREDMRKESFDQFLQIEKNQSDLEASKDLLQINLQSEQDNVATLVQEITSRKAELEKALILAEHAKLEAQLALSLREEFISLASHELKTPLTSLTLQTQMVQHKLSQNQEVSQPQMTKLITTYDVQLKRLTRIISDMLDISRIQAGKLELEKTEIDLEHTLKQVVDLAMSIERTTINLVTQGSLVGFWDSFRVEQAILNLVTNAIKYGRGQPIEISLTVHNEEAHITVSDQGIGIKPEHLERIFRRFERAVGANEFAGLGLGLYITKQIVEAHQGKIHVESVYGKGSTFRIALPLK